MAGFVYACCKLDQLQQTKIGFTTTNPHEYCKAFARTLCPLQTLAIQPFSNARLGESMVFHLLHKHRVDPKHEVFDLSGEHGMSDLLGALEAASSLDAKAGLLIPEIPPLQEHRRPDKKRALDPIVNDEVRLAAKRLRALVRAEAAQQKIVRVQEQQRIRREEAKQAEERAKAYQEGNVVRQWLAEHVHPCEGLYVRRSQLYSAFKSQNKEEKRPRSAIGKSKFFHCLLLELGEENYKARHRDGQVQSKDVFTGWKWSDRK